MALSVLEILRALCVCVYLYEFYSSVKLHLIMHASLVRSSPFSQTNCRTLCLCFVGLVIVVIIVYTRMSHYLCEDQPK